MLLRWCRGNDLHSFFKDFQVVWIQVKIFKDFQKKSVERFQFPIKLFLIYSLVLLVRGLWEISLILIIWIDLTDMKYIYAINLKEHKNLTQMKQLRIWTKLSSQLYPTQLVCLWKMKKIFSISVSRVLSLNVVRLLFECCIECDWI
jgi:hypothetical protein